MADYATLLNDHVTLTCRCVDHVFLQAYVPQLQAVGQVCNFLHHQRGFTIPSSAAFGQIGKAYVAQVQDWAEQRQIPIHRFKKGENKEAIARPFIEAAAKEGGEGRVVLIGIAQEKASVWRSWKAKGQEHTAHPHMSGGARMPTSTTSTSTSGTPIGRCLLEDQRLRALPHLAVAQWPRVGQASAGTRGHRLLTTAFAPAQTASPCNRSAIVWGRQRSTAFSPAGSRRSPRRCCPRTARLATPTSWPFVSSRCPTRGSSTALRLGAPSSKA